MKAIGYIRVSTDKQELGPEVQRMAINTKARELGLDVNFYEDIGVSGKVGHEKREGLTEALAVMGKNDVLIVARLDRLSRDLFNQLVIEKLVEKQKGKLISCAGEGTEDEGPSAKMFRNMLGVISEYERDIIRLRTRTAVAVKKKRGEKCGGFVKYGYRVEDGKLIPDESEQGTIKYMHALKNAGDSAEKIARQLNQSGFRPRRGGKWSGALVRRILNRV